MAEPSKLLLKLSRQLFSDPNQEVAFLQALTQGQASAPALLWMQTPPADSLFECLPILPWQPTWVDRLAPHQQPGQHPLHDQGAFYCLDFSSVFAAMAFINLPQIYPLEMTPIVVDLCAAPGGKSALAWRALNPSQLLCNEVIGKRLGMLISNLKRCQIAGTIVLHQDSQNLAEQIPEMAHVVIVDAPCSGQSLMAKGDKAPGCFHPVQINKNANRQKRILANASQLVAGGGYLAYMTCTYSIAENEAICQWFLTRFPHFQILKIPQLEAFQSPLTALFCYRLWPQAGLGAGAFTALFHNRSERPKQSLKASTLQETLKGLTIARVDL
jgi:16S rRNA C967 or C1407 C5-methylase (RsmB/RsmF family)